MAEWNPWWESRVLIEKLIGKTRPNYKKLVESVSIKEVIIITGVRRSGKSTIMYQMIKNLLDNETDPKQVLFVNFDDKKLSQDALEDIYECYRANLNTDKKAYIFLDEIHKKPGWESWIRKKYDLKSNDKFVISGSCSYLLKKEYSTLLTGRNLSFEVFPLDFEEFLSFNDISINISNLEKGILTETTRIKILHALKEYLKLGGFPEIVLKESGFKELVLKQYFDDILYKDIIDRHNINSQKVKDLASYLITNFTSEVSLRNLRNSLGIAYDTIKDYISYYTEAFLFFTLGRFSYSIKEQKTTPEKIYCIDNGLRNAVSFKFSEDEGKLAENLVFIELKRRNKEVYYWKSKKQEEVDFIVKNSDNSLTAINVCYANIMPEREEKSILKLISEIKKVKQTIIITKDIKKSKGKIVYIPLWQWLLLHHL